MSENPILLDPIIRNALAEDLGIRDWTTDLILDPAVPGKAVLLAREDLVLAGCAVFSRVFDILDPAVTCAYAFRDGQAVPAGGEICAVAGPAHVLLKGERTALNFMQRMSGIATLTRRYVERVASWDVRIVDTRKTVPGLRMLDKYAVRMGGGFNHRLGLSDGILIKDNHIVAAGSIRRAVELAKAGAPHPLRIEVEVEDLAGLEEAIGAGADIVLLDNMSAAAMKEAVDLAAGRVWLEASGNINLDNVAAVAATGVDFISVGALTHSPRAVDLSLEWRT